MNDEDFTIQRLCDALERLLEFSRVSTFDEEDGEREAVTYAKGLLAAHGVCAAGTDGA